jgi:hypothetical protein
MACLCSKKELKDHEKWLRKKQSEDEKNTEYTFSDIIRNIAPIEIILLITIVICILRLIYLLT